jgi:tetratricopeptide (TPR) repeat protein
MEEPAIDSPSDGTATDGPQSWVEEGRAHYRQGEYELALSCLNRAYEKYVENDDSSQLAEIANDLGVVYTVLRQWNQAEKWIVEAQAKFVEMGDYDGEAQTLGNMGSMYRAHGDLRQAAAHFQLAADRFHLVGDQERRAMTLKALGMIRLRQFRFLQALATFEAALQCLPNPTFLQRLMLKIVALPLRGLYG